MRNGLPTKKRYKIDICEEEVYENGNRSIFRPRVEERLIFQIILPEEEIDIKAVMRQTVAGKGVVSIG